MTEALKHTDHRPWTMPSRPWVMHMNWLDLLFAHWPVSVEQLRPHIPKTLEIDCFEGQAWIGVVPFRMTGVRPRFCPSIPGLSAFVELNVRTYVSAQGKPGVWFFSLDAAQRLAVWGARWSFHLPYFNADMAITEQRQGEAVRYQYRSQRTHKGAAAACFEGWYEPVGEVYRSQAGSLEHWLTERYCLYAANSRGQVYRGEIHHEPWPLQKARAEISQNTMCEAAGVTLPESEPVLHFAKFIPVLGWLNKAL